MKSLKRISGILLVVAFALISIFQSTEVFAQEAKGSITIEKAVKRETYSIYKILTLESYDKDNNHYIYRVNEGWLDFIESGAGKDYLQITTVNNGNAFVEWKTGVSDSDATVQNLAKAALAYAKTNNITATASKEATSTTVSFSNLDLGYYVVSSSLGALCNLTTNDNTATIYEKNTIVPIIDKQVKEDSTGSYGDTNDDIIGRIIDYKTTITVGAGFYNYILHDTMSAGLTLEEGSIEVTCENITEDDYTITYGEDNDTFRIEFDNNFIKSLPNQTEIIVTYQARLNDNAVIYEANGEGNTNTAYLDYENKNTVDSTPEHTTTTYTYAFDLLKIDGETNTKIDGAEFKLYDNNGTTEIKVVLVKTDNNGVNYYRIATNEEINNNLATIITVGQAVISGLDKDNYYLEEVTAPTGYNPLTSKVQITINGMIEEEETYTRTSTTIENFTGIKLPETGGKGARLLMFISSTLMLGFGVLLVTKLRMAKLKA